MKTALITGATDGIGKALALKLLKENFRVILIGRNPKKVNTTIADLKAISKNIEVYGITSDLSRMSDVALACNEFLKYNSTLDLLVLNANAIANERIITTEGNEQNFALGYLSRVLMIQKLKSVLEKTTKSQIISVIGLDVSRLDFSDITISNKFTGRKGLTRWQWAINLFTHYYNQHSSVPMNLYMPGLVKTKILKNEPQPSRLFVQIMNLIIGLSPEKAADNMYKVINEIDKYSLTDKTFSYSKQRKSIKLETHTGDIERLVALTNSLLEKY